MPDITFQLLQMATHLPVELPKIADFGISLRPKAEIFVDVLPQITMVDQDVFSFALVSSVNSTRFLLFAFTYFYIHIRTHFNFILRINASVTKLESSNWLITSTTQ